MASSSKALKRSRAAVDAETDMLIKTADGEPLPAESSLLRVFSSCAKQLPADTAEWDVSGFLYSNGQPFSRDTIKCWLSCAASVAYGPAELNADEKAQLSTATGLHAVLAFAHAVGSTVPVLTAACSQLDSLRIVVQLPEQTLELPVSGKSACVFKLGGLQLCCVGPAEPVGQPLASEQQKKELQRQISEQIGGLLHVAHVLQLQPLIEVLHNHILYASRYNNDVLYGVLELVFTDSTMEVVLGSGTLSKETYIESVLTRPCLFAEGMEGSLLKPVGRFELICAETGTLGFDAALLKDFGRWRSGQEVRIELSLFNDAPVLFIDENPMPAELLLGRTASDSDRWQLRMCGNLP